VTFNDVKSPAITLNKKIKNDVLLATRYKGTNNTIQITFHVIQNLFTQQKYLKCVEQLVSIIETTLTETTHTETTFDPYRGHPFLININQLS